MILWYNRKRYFGSWLEGSGGRADEMWILDMMLKVKGGQRTLL